MLDRTALGSAMLCLLLAGVVALLAVRAHHDAAVRSDRGEALAASRIAARHLLSYDYRHIDADIARATADTTGSFRNDYAATARRLAVEARKVRAIVAADVKSAAVLEDGTDQVVVLLFVDQTSVKQLPGQARPVSRRDQNRVRMTLTSLDGHWRVSDLASL
jgi:Mce-associated membrane protein